MTDIVERLRTEASYWHPSHQKSPIRHLLEAAEEIERLRAQMESGNFLTENDKLSLAIERQALEIKERDDEIERLRKTLQIVFDRCGYDAPDQEEIEEEIERVLNEGKI
jgi:hypothetical protein